MSCRQQQRSGECWAYWQTADAPGYHRCELDSGHGGTCRCCCGSITENATMSPAVSQAEPVVITFSLEDLKLIAIALQSTSEFSDDSRFGKLFDRIAKELGA